MCGLFGIASNRFLTKQEKFFLEELGVNSSPRGRHSTGVCGIEYLNDHDRKTRKKWKDANALYLMEKDTLSPTEFFRDPRWKKFAGSKNNAIIGHNRFATVGEVTQAGAHPFKKGNCVGTHNGTLHGFFKKDEGYESDSDKLFTLLSRNNNDLRKTLSPLEERSAYALVFSDWMGRIRFFRNDERPLWLAANEDRTLFAWASEERFIRSAAYRSQLKLHYLEELPKNMLLTMSIQKDKPIRLTKTYDYLEEALIEKHEKKFKQPAQQHNQRNPRHNSNQNTRTQTPARPWPNRKNYGTSNTHGRSGTNDTYTFDVFTEVIRICKYVDGQKWKQNITSLATSNQGYDEALFQFKIDFYSKIQTPFLWIDTEKDYAVYARLPKAKKIKIKRIKTTHSKYSEWYHLASAQEEEFLHQIELAQESYVPGMRKPEVSDLKITRCDFNQLRRAANILSYANQEEYQYWHFHEMLAGKLSAPEKNQKKEDQKPKKTKSADIIPFSQKQSQDSSEKQKKQEAALLEKKSQEFKPKFRILTASHTQVQVIPINAKLLDYRMGDGNVMDIEDAKKKLNITGCSVCSSPLELIDEVYWNGPNHIICGKCSTLPVVHEQIPSSRLTRGYVNHEN